MINNHANPPYRIMAIDGHGGVIVRRTLDGAVSAAMNTNSTINKGVPIAIYDRDGDPIQAYDGDRYPIRAVELPRAPIATDCGPAYKDHTIA